MLKLTLNDCQRRSIKLHLYYFPDRRIWSLLTTPNRLLFCFCFGGGLLSSAGSPFGSNLRVSDYIYAGWQS